MNTKKVLGIAAVTLLVAVVLAGAGAAAVGDGDVAKIGDTGYATLALAVAEATDGDTIVVLKDCSIDADLTIGHTITFANNGTNHLITVNDGTGLTTITIASGKTVNFGTTVSESGYSGLLIENPAYKNGSSSPLLTIEDGAGVSGLYLKASTATVQGYLDEVVLIKGAAAVADSVFDFSGIKNAEQGGYLSPQMGVAVEGTGDVTLKNCSITTGDDADHKSMPLMVSKSSGKVTITDGSLTAGDSKDDRESVCLRICGQGAGDDNAIILNGVTLNAVKNGDRNVGIAVDHKTGIAADAVLDLQNVTFNVNGWELWKEDDTNPNTVKIGTLSGLGDALNLSMCSGVGKITLAGIGTTTVDSNAVAKIGDTYYAALSDAVADANAATSNVTLTLLKDIKDKTDTGAHFTNTAATVTFDLNGHTMSYAELAELATWENPAEGKHDINGIIVNEGKLVIRDSATGGKISSEADGGATNTCVFNAPGATCTIESGSFVMGEVYPKYSGFYAILNAGTMTIKGGSFVFDACGSSLVSNWNTMTVTGGSFTIDNTACTKYVFNNEKGTDYGISTTPSLTISGSGVTVTHRNADGVALRCLDAGSTATISSGTISGTLVNSKSGQENGIISCTGGTYTVNPTAFVAAGYHAEAQGTTPETWKIVVDTTYYTVSFNMQGHGTQVQPQSIEEGKCATKPADPTAEGYSFGGWYTTAACTTAFDFNTVITGDTMLYAKWTEGKATVSFDMRGHGTQIASQTVTIGGTATEPADPEATGYEFGGWFTEAECTNAYDFGTTVTGNLTLYASWTKSVEYTVSMADYAYGNAGTPTITPEASVTYYYSSSATGSGYPWSTEAGDLLNVGTYYMYAVVDGKETLKTAFNVTKAAQTEVPNFNVEVLGGTTTVHAGIYYADCEYRIGEGTWSPVPAAVFDLSGLNANTTYSISMRYKESQNYSAGEAVSDTFTTLSKYSVKYNANRGTNAPDDQEEYAGTPIIITTDAPTRDGYTFMGWNTASDGTGTGYSAGDSIDTGAVLYALWKAHTYQVIYDANGGSGTMPTDEFMTGEEKELSANRFTNSGYTFAGWAKSAEGSAVYSDRQRVQDIGTGEVTLYAVWILTAKTTTVDGTIAGATDVVTVELKKGNAVIDSQTVNTSYSFTGVPDGTYNIVATSGEKVVTKLITIENGVVTGDRDIVFPIGDVSSKVDVGTANDTPAIAVGNLDKEAEAKAEEGKTVVINMNVEAKVQQDVPEDAATEEKEVQAAISDIKEQAESTMTEPSIVYVDIAVKKDVTDNESKKTETTKVSETSEVIGISVPYNLDGMNTVSVLKNHNGKTSELDEESSQDANTFEVNWTDNKVTIYANEFSVYAIAASAKETPTPTTTGSSSSVTSFTGEKDGNNFTFSNATVITKMTLPGASYAKVTNTSGSGWYNCSLSTDGNTGIAYFQVPLDVLNVKGYTVNDVSFAGNTTTYLKSEGGYAKYSAPVTGSGAYSIAFVKGAATAAVEKVQEAVEQKQTATEQKQAAAEKVKDVVEQKQTTTQTAAKTPFPILGILAGLGIAGLVAVRMRK